MDKLKEINSSVEKAASRITGRWVQELEKPFVDFRGQNSR